MHQLQAEGIQRQQYAAMMAPQMDVSIAGAYQFNLMYYHPAVQQMLASNPVSAAAISQVQAYYEYAAAASAMYGVSTVGQTSPTGTPCHMVTTMQPEPKFLPIT